MSMFSGDRIRATRKIACQSFLRTGNRQLLPAGVSAWEGCSRGDCALCENLVFAERRGLAIDAEALRILGETRRGV
jgi:hypothetical protein